jgi:hypothetical protein
VILREKQAKLDVELRREEQTELELDLELAAPISAVPDLFRKSIDAL